MKSKTNITKSQINKLLNKIVMKLPLLSDLSEHELYILLRATFNELGNKGCKMSLLEILRLNADCIIDD